MSFILDALRKSDSERQQQATPGLASTVQRKEPRRRNFWIPLLVVVLGLNAILGWFLMRDDEPVGNETPPVEPVTRSLRKEPVPSQRPAAPVKPAPTQAAVSPPVAAAAPATTTPLAPAAQTEVAPAEPATPPSPDAGEATLPSFEQLLVAGMISSPQLHLDIHVFAPDSAKRFVFINMRKYREGERLEEGAVVEAITETGVILRQNGNRFTLERR